EKYDKSSGGRIDRHIRLLRGLHGAIGIRLQLGRSLEPAQERAAKLRPRGDLPAAGMLAENRIDKRLPLIRRLFLNACRERSDAFRRNLPTALPGFFRGNVVE